MKVIFAILLAMFTTTVYAQTEITSIHAEVDSVGVDYSPATDSITPVATMYAPRFHVSFYSNTHILKPYESAALQIPSVSFMPGQANLYSWRNGSIMATGTEMDMPGMIRIDLCWIISCVYSCPLM